MSRWSVGRLRDVLDYVQSREMREVVDSVPRALLSEEQLYEGVDDQPPPYRAEAYSTYYDCLSASDPEFAVALVRLRELATHIEAQASICDQL